MINESNKKIIVAHPGKQHSFQVAKALNNNNMLFKYITTVYDKDSSLLMKIIKKIVKGDNLKRASNRKSKYISDSDVLSFYSFLGIIEILLYRLDKKKKIYMWWHRITTSFFGKKVARYAIKNNVDAVILYNTNSKECFEILKEKAPHIKRIMDVAAANRNYMKMIYEKDMTNTPSFSNKLRKEVWVCWDRKSMTYNKSEIELTDYFLVPSQFVKESIKYEGVKEKQILVCPYGTNFNLTEDKKINTTKEKLSILYVGNVTQLKGIYYLLEGLKSFSTEEIEVNIVGKFDNSEGLFTDYLDRYNFAGQVTHDKVLDFYKNADIFVFPSLGEGMSLACLEAMGCGLPIICSTNSGVNDLVTDGVNGFVIPIGDRDVIRDKVQWFINNKNEIGRMGENARKIALNYTWDNYGKNVTKLLKDILN